MYQRTSATNKILELKKRIRGVAGGTSASKTISILMWLIQYAQTTEGEIISVVSESMPHLKRGAMRDFVNIMQEHGYFVDAQWNKSDFIYTFLRPDKPEWKPTIIEFFSADQPAKVRGPRRHILFLNEANNVPLETFTQLEIRTSKIIWLDWNPVSEFYWYTDILPAQDVDFLTLTYRDNEALAPSIVASIESRRSNRAWWKVYGEGQLGEVEARIYTGWQIIDEIPHEAKRERHWLDFGYSNDPAAMGAVYKYNGGLILDEILYRKGMTNAQLAEVLKNEDYALTIADSSEPKSIDEIASYGVSIVGADKGKDSILHGIQYVQGQRISVTKRSVNILKEYRNYLWMTDKNDKIINVPNDMMNHHMDGIRYAISNIKSLEYDADIEEPAWAQNGPTWAK